MTWTDKDHKNNDNWDNPNNWSTMKVPDKTSDVIVNSGTPEQPVVDVSPEVNNLSLNSGTVRLGAKIRLAIDGNSISNNKGRLVLDEGILDINGSKVTLSGDGSLIMSDSSFNAIFGLGNTFVNNLKSPADIEGAGIIGAAGPQLENLGIINATYSAHALRIGDSHSTTINEGVLESTNGELLLLGKYENAVGSIQANGGTVVLSSCTIEGGTLSNSFSGVISPNPGHHPPTLDGVINEAFYRLNSGSSTILKGTITNNGQFQMNDTTGKGTSLIIENIATLKGTGIVTVSAGSRNTITGSGHFINKETIQGPITVTVTKLDNAGTIQNLPGTNNPLTFKLRSGVRFSNRGTVASDGGTVLITGPGTFDNRLGNINTDNLIVADGQPTIVGGNITGSGTLEGKKVTIVGPKKDSAPGSIGAVTNTATFLINAGDTTTFKGGFINNGIVDMTAIGCQTCSNATAVISGSVNLAGTGVWKLESLNGFTGVITGATGNDTLTNSSTIQGTGVIGNNSMNLVNAAKGQIVANSSRPLVISMGSGNVFTNNGPLLVAAIGGQSPSVLTLTGPFANFNPNTGTLTGGIYNIAGTFQFDNANIVNNAANLTLAGQIINQNNVNGLANFVNNTSTGVFTLLPPTFGPFTSAGPFSNAGKVTVSKGSKFSVGGSGTNYNQTGGTTTVDGTLAVPLGGLIGVTGGTFQGAGTFSGSVALGNTSGAAPVWGKVPGDHNRTARVTETARSHPSGTIAILIVGDSTKQEGQISVTNDYTQLLTGVLDVQIGGTTAGSQYSQLNVTDAANLNGTLNIKLINKFLPSVGQTFNILTSSSLNGTFSKVNGKKINSSEHFEVSYSSTGVVLTVVSGPEEAPPGAN